jgi:hypothetical protein
MTSLISGLKQNNTAVMDLLTKQHVAMNLEMTSAKESLRAMVEALLGREIEVQDSSSLETVVPKKRVKKEVKPK